MSCQHHHSMNQKQNKLVLANKNITSNMTHNSNQMGSYMLDKGSPPWQSMAACHVCVH